jgi:hypothetical protein
LLRLEVQLVLQQLQLLQLVVMVQAVLRWLGLRAGRCAAHVQQQLVDQLLLNARNAGNLRTAALGRAACRAGTSNRRALLL